MPFLANPRDRRGRDAEHDARRGSVRERAAAAVAESLARRRLALLSLHARQPALRPPLPGRERRRAQGRDLLALDEESLHPERLCAALDERGRQVLYTPETVVVAPRPPLFAPHLRESPRPGVPAARRSESAGCAGSRPRRYRPLALLGFLILGWPLLLAGGGLARRWVACGRPTLAARPPPARSAALRFQSLRGRRRWRPSGSVAVHVTYALALTPRPLRAADDCAPVLGRDPGPPRRARLPAVRRRHALRRTMPTSRSSCLRRPARPTCPEASCRSRPGSESDTSPAEKRDAAFPHATGDVLAYIDDDAYPRRGLARAVRRGHFDDPVRPGGRRARRHAARLAVARARRRRPSTSRRPAARRSGTASFRGAPAHGRRLPRLQLLRPPRGARARRRLGHDLLRRRGHRALPEARRGRLARSTTCPEVVVFHRRRPIFEPHLRQIANVGRHRGYFVRAFPATSRRALYALPALAPAVLAARRRSSCRRAPGARLRRSPPPGTRLVAAETLRRHPPSVALGDAGSWPPRTTSPTGRPFCAGCSRRRLSADRAERQLRHPDAELRPDARASAWRRSAAQDYPGRVEIVDRRRRLDRRDARARREVRRRAGRRQPAADRRGGKARGARAARGEVLAFVDSDNILVGTDWLRRMTAPFRRPGDREHRGAALGLRARLQPRRPLLRADRRQRPRVALRRQLRTLLVPHRPMDGLPGRAGAARRLHPGSRRPRAPADDGRERLPRAGRAVPQRPRRATTSSTSTPSERSRGTGSTSSRASTSRSDICSRRPTATSRARPAGAPGTSSTTAGGESGHTRGSATDAGSGFSCSRR